MIYLQTNESLSLPIDTEILEQAAQETLRHQSAPAEAELTLVLTDDEQLRQLNHEFLGVDAPTDVLSFPSSELDPDTGSIYLGDVVISLPHALAQADAGGHPIADELQLLVVHGILHLVGYDHLEQVDKEKMQVAQDNVLHQLGVRLVSTL